MVRLGVVGLGARMESFMKHSLRQVLPEIKISGIVDPDEEGVYSRLTESDREDATFYPNLDEMVRKGKVNALAIGTRCNLHTPYAVEAAKYDLPLFLEKPVAVSMEQAQELERAFEKSRCSVVVSFPLRVSPLCTLARKHIEEGAVGSPEHVLGINYVSYGTCYFSEPGRNYEITQGLFLQKATHDLDYMSYLMGSNIVKVAAMASLGRVFGGSKPSGLRCSECDEEHTCPESPQNRKRNGSGGIQRDHLCLFSMDCGNSEEGMNEDSSSVLLEFANGARGVYTQVFYTRRDAAARGATVSGYQGTVSFDWCRNELKRVRHHQPFTDVTRAGEGTPHFGGDIELAHDFIGLITGKCRSRTPIWTGIESAYTCLAAKESAEKGVFVKVRQIGQA